jgi:predicted DsbA family dithiol-disulfide isomerase
MLKRILDLVLTKVIKPNTLLVVVCTVLLSISTIAEAQQQNAQQTNKIKKMKVEIWSDVMCPFCYIGKRKFESALQQFEHKDNVEVVWKSFQLQPDMITDSTKNTTQHLAESKGWTLEHAREMTSHVTNIAKEVGLTYNFDKAIVANSFDAHRLVQLAKTKGKGDAMEEQLFKAYFIDGKNTADHTTLTALATAIGLDETEVKQVLATDAYSDKVREDIYQSQQIGVTGVPFFVLDNKYAVSGAQASETFLGALKQAWNESDKTGTIEGAVCTPDGNCD